MHNDVQFSAMFFGKNIQNIPIFNPTQTSVKEFDSYGLKVFTFTGKERDSETGFSYFGARYYDSDILTGWLSVDPMADKYPSLSPYAYCGWNPVKLVDPDGEDIYYFDKSGKYTHKERMKGEHIGVFLSTTNKQIKFFSYRSYGWSTLIHKRRTHDQ
jgi:RHS repeat-associated protein